MILDAKNIGTAIAPLKRNIPLTDADLLSLEELLFNAEAVESRERFEEVYGKNLNLKLFIRQLIGLDRNAAKEAFGKYLEGVFSTLLRFALWTGSFSLITPDKIERGYRT